MQSRKIIYASKYLQGITYLEITIYRISNKLLFNNMLYNVFKNSTFIGTKLIWKQYKLSLQ